MPFASHGSLLRQSNVGYRLRSGTSCHTPKLHRVTLSIFFAVEKDIFLNQSYLALNFPGYKTGNVSTIKILPQNKMVKQFHVPDDIEIEELLEVTCHVGCSRPIK
jgi:hypothetical protein